MECYCKDYPRPQFVRPKWENLNGEWDFAFDDHREGENRGYITRLPQPRTIQVPFTYETKLSGINEKEPHCCVWYQKTIDIYKTSGRVFLHFEGSDYHTKVWVNGRLAGTHRGGYCRFSFDITELSSQGANLITIKVNDSLDRAQLRGKQKWKDKSFECWYTQTTGIWKTLWLEYTPDEYIQNVKMTPDLENLKLNLQYDIQLRERTETEENRRTEENTQTDKYLHSCVPESDYTIEARVSFEGKWVNTVTVPVIRRETEVQVDMYAPHLCNWGVMTWLPDRPALYDITFTLRKEGQPVDEVGSYFGMRSISIEGSQVLLNGDPIYQRLILDQGYWEESHLTPPDEEAIIEDIDKIHALGYNGLRKHQKIEDERFLYWCDVKGMLVWCEAPSTYAFHDRMVDRFIPEWTEIIHQHYNHPSIITWTPINESWGVFRVKNSLAQQSFTQAVYYLTKAYDPMRPVIVNDGWEHTCSDIITLHDYQEFGERFLSKYQEQKDEILGNQIFFNGGRKAFANGFAYKGQPVIISEYGGIAFSHEDKEAWGYGSAIEGEEAFLKRFESITSAIQKLKWVCGYCYTQITDVQQEINGVLDQGRKCKVDAERFREINQRKFWY